MTTAPPAASILDEVATWPGVSTQPTPRGATAIVLDGHELGHVHPDRGTLDLPLPDDRRGSEWWRVSGPVSHRAKCVA
jgi:Family of unknown function (DUF5519)